MITKLAELYYNGTEVVGVKNVKGYNIGFLEFVVPENGAVTFAVFGTNDGTSPSSSSSRVPIYDDDNNLINTNQTLNTAGTYKYKLDITSLTNINISVTNVTGNIKRSLVLSQNKFELFNANKKFVSVTSGKNINVSEYNSAVLKVTATESLTMSVQKDDVTSTIYSNGEIGFKGNINLGNGTYLFTIDLHETEELRITSSDYSNISLALNKELVSVKGEQTIIKSNLFTIDVTGIDSFEVNVNCASIAENANPYFKITDENNNPLFVDNGNTITVSPRIVVGSNRFVVGCNNTSKVTFQLMGSATINNIVINSDATFERDKYVKERGLLNFIDASITLDGGKQLDFNVAGSGRIKVEGSNDNFATSEGIYIYNSTTNTVRRSDQYIQLPGNNVVQKIFANVEGYAKIRIRQLMDASCFVNGIVVSNDYVEGRKILLNNLISALPFYKGYRYFKIKYLESAVFDGTTVEGSVYNTNAALQFYHNPYNETYKIYNLAMERIKIASSDNNRYYLRGLPTDGGFIVELPNVVDVNTYIKHGEWGTSGEHSAKPIFTAECYTDKPEGEKGLLKKVYEHEDYDVYKLPSDSVNRDVLNSDIVEWTNDSITFYHGGYYGIQYYIPFDSEHFSGIVEGETIRFVYLLPMHNNTNAAVADTYNPSRIVVFTNSRIYHSYPTSKASDGVMFAESSVYNVYKKWLPVNNKGDVDANHKYFPVLADYDYSQYEGRYEKGIGSSGIIQNIPMRNAKFWDRLMYSNMTKGPKWCTWGNYNNEDGSEPLVMSTNNGGKTWFVQAYFACTDFYNYMRGSNIDLSAITNVSSYVGNSLKMCRKRFNVPTDAVKEPSTPFVIDVNDQVLVSSFEVNNDGECLVNLSSAIDYDGVYPIVYFENVSADSEWNYICNNGFTADGVVNNGIFFRVKKVTTTQYKLYADLGNPYEGDKVCRHIHAVNSVESGVLISTGESYSEINNGESTWFEGGFIYHLAQNQRNGHQVDNITSSPSVIRLCSSPRGVNRACGAFLFSDEADPTLLYVSDESFVVKDNHKRYASIPGRTVKVPITPAGVFVGKLSDIDDQTKFKNVCELQLTGVGLIESHGHFAVDGSSQVCFSKDGFKWNIDVHDETHINGSDNFGNIYFGDKVAIFK